MIFQVISNRALIFCLDSGKCEQPLGMEDKTIPDSSITASGVYEDYPVYCSEVNGRLNQVNGSWCPRSETASWFQVDLKIQTQVEGVIMQGSYLSTDKEWVKSYTVEYSSDQTQWDYVGGTTKATAQVSHSTEKLLCKIMGFFLVLSC